MAKGIIEQNNASVEFFSKIKKIDNKWRKITKSQKSRKT